MVDGKPTYTDLITATPTNSKGWNLDQSLAMYCPAANDSATVQMKSYFEQVRIKSQEQKDALAFWSIPKYSVSPTNATYTNAESIVARKLSDVKTYADEMRARFVMGTEPIENFDKFVIRCKELGIDDVLMVYNDAYKRFNKR
jgi:putative aldouronate transport system substrate-binding protein